MVKRAIIEQIKNDFAFLKANPNIMGLLLYGSHILDENTARSDIDICIVTPNQDLYQIYKFVMKKLECNTDIYDIRFFEELPLHIQGEIIENGVVVICQDEPTLFEYFFKYRKLWEDQKYRLKSIAF